MKKTITKIICCALIISSAFAFTACSSKNNDDITTTSSTTSTTAATAQPTSEAETSQMESTSQTTTKKKPNKSTTTEFVGEMSISVNQALDALNDMYPKDYEVNATVKEDGYQFFAVYDKNGNKYASVKVNLDNADATETVLSTGDTNEYNLLA